MSTQISAYERLGGVDGVDRLIAGFYDLVNADEMLAPFFAHADMTRLLSMQHEYIATALGGPPSLATTEVHHAHAGRGIRGRHYVRFLELFFQALSAAGLDQDEIDRVLDRMALAAPDVIDETSDPD